MEQYIFSLDCQDTAAEARLRFAAPQAVHLYANRPLPPLPQCRTWKRPMTLDETKEHGRLTSSTSSDPGNRPHSSPHPSALSCTNRQTRAIQHQHMKALQMTGINVDLPEDSTANQAQARSRCSTSSWTDADRAASWTLPASDHSDNPDDDGALLWLPSTGDDGGSSSHNAWSLGSGQRMARRTSRPCVSGGSNSDAWSGSHVVPAEEVLESHNLFHRHSNDPAVAGEYHKIAIDLAAPSGRHAAGGGRASMPAACRGSPSPTGLRFLSIPQPLRRRRLAPPAIDAAIAQSTSNEHPQRTPYPSGAVVDPLSATVTSPSHQSVFESDSDDEYPGDTQTGWGGSVRKWFLHKSDDHDTAGQVRVDDTTQQAGQPSKLGLMAKTGGHMRCFINGAKDRFQGTR